MTEYLLTLNGLPRAGLLDDGHTQRRLFANQWNDLKNRLFYEPKDVSKW
jgi:hypothetical protein